MGAELAQDALLHLTGITESAEQRHPAPWRRVISAWRRGRGKVAPARVARAVMLSDRYGEALAVIPADRRIDLTALAGEFGRNYRIVENPGTNPPGVLGPHNERRRDIYVDQALVGLPEVYVETREPGFLACLDGETFRSLFYGSWCGHISRPPT